MKNVLLAALFVSLSTVAPLASGEESLLRSIKTAMEAKVAQTLQGAGGESRYFVTIFGYQSKGNDPHESHTFAVFTKAKRGQRAVSTISWLPADFGERRELCVFKGPLWWVPGWNECDPTIGHNYGFEQTVRFAIEGKRDVAMWGPYQIKKKLYELSRDRKAELEQGRLEYMADDRMVRDAGVAVNCLHAVSDLGGSRAPQGGPLRTELGIWGILGTKHILKHYQDMADEWLVDPIDRDQYISFKYSTE